VTEHLLDLGVGQHDAARLVHNEDPIGRELDDHPTEVLPQHRWRQLALGFEGLLLDLHVHTLRSGICAVRPQRGRRRWMLEQSKPLPDCARTR
jgi:hypothetical protein